MSIHYLEDMGCGNLYFSYIGEDCLDVFVKKLDKILSNFETFERKIEMKMTDGQAKTQGCNSLLLMQ